MKAWSAGLRYKAAAAHCVSMGKQQPFLAAAGSLSFVTLFSAQEMKLVETSRRPR